MDQEPLSSAQEEFDKVPSLAAFPSLVPPRVSVHTIAESTLTGITLTDEFVMPTEIDDVYHQLEVLSTEIRGLQHRDDTLGSGRDFNRQKAARTIQAGIDQLRVEVQHLRNRTPTPTSDPGRTSPEAPKADPLAMLNDLILLRSEIEELLVEQMHLDRSQIERLPSYHSRKAPAFDVGPRPPLPHQDKSVEFLP